MCFVVFHMYHYIIQVSSKPIHAFKVVIRHLRMQQTSVTYLALVLAKPPSVKHSHHLLHYDIKHKNQNEQFWLHLSCQDGSSALAPLLYDRSGNREPLEMQLGNPVKAERLMHFGGVVFEVCSLRSAFP